MRALKVTFFFSSYTVQQQKKKGTKITKLMEGDYNTRIRSICRLFTTLHY